MSISLSCYSSAVFGGIRKRMKCVGRTKVEGALDSRWAGTADGVLSDVKALLHSIVVEEEDVA